MPEILVKDAAEQMWERQKSIVMVLAYLHDAIKEGPGPQRRQKLQEARRYLDEASEGLYGKQP